MQRNDTRPGASIDVQALLAEVESLTRIAERSGAPVTAGTDAPRRADRPQPALASVAAGPVSGPITGEAAGEAAGRTHPLDAASVSMAPVPIGRGPADRSEAPAIDDVGRTARAVQIAMPVALPEPPTTATVPAEPPARAAGSPGVRRARGGGSKPVVAAGEWRRPDEPPVAVRASDPRTIPQATSRVRTRSSDGDVGFGTRFGSASEVTVELEPRRSVFGLVATLPFRLFALPIDLLPPAGRTLVSIVAGSMILAAPVAWLLAWRNSTQPGVGPIPAVNLPGASASEPKPAPRTAQNPLPADPGLSPASAPAR